MVNAQVRITRTLFFRRLELKLEGKPLHIKEQLFLINYLMN